MYKGDPAGRQLETGEPVTWNQIIAGMSDVLLLAQADGGAAEGAGGDGNGAAAPPPNAPGNSMMQLMLMLIIGVFFYMIVIRPQTRAQKQKRQKHEQLLAALKKNDRIVTVGGIIGTVAEITDERVTIKIDDNTRMKVLRSSVQELLNEKSEKSELD